MKYLAILRDSFRESIDSKVIYVLVAMSLLATLFMLSISYTPQSAQQAMSFAIEDNMGHGFPWSVKVAGLKRSKRPPRQDQLMEFDMAFKTRLQVQKVELVKGETDSPESTYRLTLVRSFATPEKAQAIRANPEEGVAAVKKQLELQEQYKLFKVTDIKQLNEENANPFDSNIRFEVTTEPAEASRNMWPHEIRLFFGAFPLGTDALGFLLSTLSGTLLLIGSMVTMLVSVVITAFFIPNMLRKGSVDLLIVKPIHRWLLLVYKYVGGLTFVFLNTTVAMLGIWLAFGLRSGIWANSFLIMIFVYTFFFAILYAVSALIAVMTRSSIVAMLVTCAAWFLFFIVGLLNWVGDVTREAELSDNRPQRERVTEQPFFQVVLAIHFVLPRTGDIDAQGRLLLEQDFKTTAIADATTWTISNITWGENIAVSLAFIAVMLGLACWWFSTKDY